MGPAFVLKGFKKKKIIGRRSSGVQHHFPGISSSCSPAKRIETTQVQERTPMARLLRHVLLENFSISVLASMLKEKLTFFDC